MKPPSIGASADIVQIWERLEIWLSLHAPNLLQSLQTGAGEVAISDAETLVGARFPADFRASLRIHNGQNSFAPGLMCGRELLNLGLICEEWTLWKGVLDSGDFQGLQSLPQARIRPGWWRKGWIPITHDGCGNHECLDLQPTNAGFHGQIIEFWHDDPIRAVAAESFLLWLAQFVTDCENGTIVFHPEWQELTRIEDILPSDPQIS